MRVGSFHVIPAAMAGGAGAGSHGAAGGPPPSAAAAQQQAQAHAQHQMHAQQQQQQAQAQIMAAQQQAHQTASQQQQQQQQHHQQQQQQQQQQHQAALQAQMQHYLHAHAHAASTAAAAQQSLALHSQLPGGITGGSTCSSSGTTTAAGSTTTHNLIPGAAALHAAALAHHHRAQAQMAAAAAAQAQAQAQQAAATAALVAGHGQQVAMTTTAAMGGVGDHDRRGSDGGGSGSGSGSTEHAAGGGGGTRISPVPPSFYGPASAAAAAAAAAVPPASTAIVPGIPSLVTQPTTWIASQHPPHPVPPNVPGLPLYGLPVSPVTHLPFQTLQEMVTTLGRACPPPTYNGINLNYPGIRMLSDPDTHAMGAAGSTVPPIYAVDDFLSPDECDYLLAAAGDSFTPAPVVGSGAGEVNASRTSSTVYLAREDLPLYLEKVCRLVGKPRDHCELPQVGRYFPSQQYLQHFDAFDLSHEDGQRFASNGGQRVVTVLVYLNDVEQGGSTHFPALNLDVRPRRGMAVVFFPATVDGLLDKNALHAACPAVDTKYVSQVWIRQSAYSGLPSKRIFPNEEVARRAAATFRSAPGVGAGSMPIEGLLSGGGEVSGTTSATASAAASLSPSAHSSAPTSGNGAGLASSSSSSS